MQNQAFDLEKVRRMFWLSDIKKEFLLSISSVPDDLRQEYASFVVPLVERLALAEQFVIELAVMKAPFFVKILPIEEPQLTAKEHQEALTQVRKENTRRSVYDKDRTSRANKEKRGRQRNERQLPTQKRIEEQLRSNERFGKHERQTAEQRSHRNNQRKAYNAARKAHR